MEHDCFLFPYSSSRHVHHKNNQVQTASSLVSRTQYTDSASFCHSVCSHLKIKKKKKKYIVKKIYRNISSSDVALVLCCLMHVRQENETEQGVHLQHQTAQTQWISSGAFFYQREKFRRGGNRMKLRQRPVHGSFLTRNKVIALKDLKREVFSFSWYFIVEYFINLYNFGLFTAPFLSHRFQDCDHPFSVSAIFIVSAVLGHLFYFLFKLTKNIFFVHVLYVFVTV